MTNGHITHATQEGVHVLRYFGTVNYTLAPGLQRFLQHLIHAGHVSGLVFDLSAAESLDSTNLGLMARANEEVRGAGAANSVIISSNENIDTVLRSMGFDQSFELLSSAREVPDAGDEPITAEALSAAELQRTMLEAHQALVRLSEAGRLEFEPVVACLERDVSVSS
ncbi:MAG TPA: STAS domain-containing protein [Polyangiaceae bacterium]|jgi:anti-anti-sigma factor|nr:STAS domain-containing protein [Polyangiaceae bacterium]